MKRFILVLLFAAYVSTTGFAMKENTGASINHVSNILSIAEYEKTAIKEIVEIKDKENKLVGIEFVLTCGITIQYFPPNGESCANIVNAAINFNNALCGTSIGQVCSTICGIIQLLGTAV
jgi:hypothetical protein